MTTKDEIARRKLNLLELARSFQIEGKLVQASHHVHTYPPGEER